MGFDVYCVFCGMPMIDETRHILKDVSVLDTATGRHALKSRGRYYGVSPDGVWANADAILSNLKISGAVRPIFKSWLGDVLALTKNGIVAINRAELTDGIVAVGDEYIDEANIPVFHRACYRLAVGNRPNTLARFDFRKLRRNQHRAAKYGEIAKYQGQFFYCVLAQYEGNLYMLDNPATSAKNKRRIKAIIATIPLKK